MSALPAGLTSVRRRNICLRTPRSSEADSAGSETALVSPRRPAGGQGVTSDNNEELDAPTDATQHQIKPAAARS